MAVDGFVRALDDFEIVLARVPANRWGDPSPCDGWNAADVAGHVIGDVRAVEALASGYDEADSSDAAQAIGNEPLAEWRAARAEMMAALGPAGLARLVPLPWGRQMPLGEFLERYLVEILVHTWDLAQATGQRAALDPDLVRNALVHSREFVAILRLSGLVGEERAVPDGVDDLTRLLGIFGRSAP